MTSSAQQPPSQREKKRTDTRERVFQAAVDEFAQVGFANAQIPRIAKAAGVVRGTFYFHFPSKEHVLIELAERDQDRISGELAGLRGSSASLVEVFFQLIQSVTPLDDLVHEANLRRDVLALYMRASLDEEEDAAVNDSSKPQPVLEELSHHVAEAVARGELRNDVEPERLAATVLTSIFGLIVARNGTASDHRPELELLIELLLNGMGRQPGKAASG